MASMPYPLNRLVYSYCQCDCHHSIGLYTHVCVGMAGMPYPPTDTHSSVFKKPVLLFFCLFKNNMFSCSHVFQKNMFFCLSPKRTISSVQSCLYVAKKNGWEQRSQPLSLELCLLFSKADSLLRTYACACTALCAEIRVNRILFAFWDCLYWALANTCTACDAVVTNYVSHN